MQRKTFVKMASFVDVNVLLALMHARHPFSERAFSWLETQEGRGSIVICRVVQMGLLRLLTRQAVMREDVINPAAFWRGWDQLMQDDRFVLVPEPARLEQNWRELTTNFPVGQCAETDTYLAAFALAREDTFVTFDRGFERFEGLSVEILTR